MPRREIIYSVPPCFSRSSLCAQEVGQEVKRVEQDVEQPSRTSANCAKCVDCRKTSWIPAQQFPQCGMDTAPYVPIGSIHRLGIEALHQYVLQSFPARRTNGEAHPKFLCRSLIFLQVSSNTCADRICGRPTKASAWPSTFGDRKQLGDR